MWTVILAVVLVGVALIIWLLTRRSKGKHNDAYLREKFSVKDGITFYDNAISSCARKVRITFYEKEIKHRVVDVDLTAHENRHPSYLAINPLGKVPAVVVRNVEGVPDCTLFEANAITEWLDEQFPDTVKLYPSGVWERCQVKMWQQWEMALAEDFWLMLYTNTLGFVYRAMYSYSGFKKTVPKDDPYLASKLIKVYKDELIGAKERQNVGYRLYRRLDLLEKALVGKMYVCGNSFSAADISIIPRLALFPLLGFLMTENERNRYPNIFRYLKCLSFRKTAVDADRAYDTVKLSRWLPWSIIQLIGNWRSGIKCYRIDGINILKDVKAEPLPTIPREPPSKGYEVVLYHHTPWPNSIMTYIACLEFGIKIEVREVNRMIVEHRSAMYKNINPNGEIPSILHEGRVVYDPLNIIEYLNAFFSYLSGKTFLPDGPTDLARMRMWHGWVTTCFNYQFIHLWNYYIARPILRSQFTGEKEYLETVNKSSIRSEDAVDLLSSSMCSLTSEEIATMMSPYKHGLEKALDFLERELADRKYLVGTKLSPADMSVFSLLMLYKWVTVSVPKTKFPNIVAWMERLAALPSFSVVKKKVESYMASHGLEPCD